MMLILYSYMVFICTNKEKKMNIVKLSKQQQKCLYFLSCGMTYKEIAQEMNLSPRTVESYMVTVKKKTGLTCRSKLVSFFLNLVGVTL